MNKESLTESLETYKMQKMIKKRGELILTAQPFAHVLSVKFRGHRCDSCFQSGTDLHKCSACGVLWYCNTSCQKSDWPLHKLECACLVGVAPDLPIDSVRLMLRILIRIKRNKADNLFKGDPGWRTFSALESHCAEIQRDTERCEKFSKIIFTIKKLVGEAWPLPPDDQLLDIFGKMVINTFTIMDTELTSIGAGLYLSGSTFDHSCEPNTVVTFSGCTLQARASCDIQDASPDKYRISYIDLMTTHSRRQAELQKLYYFTCSCARCSGQQLDSLMLSSLCPKAGCNGPVTQSSDGVLLSCQDCGCSDFTTDYTQMVHEMNTTLETTVNKLESLRENGNYEEILACLEDIRESQQHVCHPSNVHFIKCHDLGFDAAITLEMWDLARQYCLQTVEKFVLYYGEYHPTVGFQLLKLGKLEYYQGHLIPGQQHLQQAQNILLVTHGTSHDLYEEACRLLNECEGELKYRHTSITE